MKLTLNRIEELKCPPGKKDILVFDDEQRGLGVRVTANGSKSFLAQFRSNGQKRRIPLGSCSALSITKAREAVRAFMGDVARGADPAAERKSAIVKARRKASHDALTLAVLLDQWAALRLADKRPSYAAEAVRALRLTFKKQLPLPAADLDRAIVVRALDRLTKDGRIAMASRTAAYGRACYGWAAKRGSIEKNPFVNLPVTAVAKRDRVLTDDELAAIWQATCGQGPFNAIIRTLILTGQRREEVAGMTWAELAPDLSVWIIPASRAKNGVAHIVPLSPQAQSLLRNVPRLDERDFIFPGLRGPFNGFGKAKAHLDNASGVAKWRLHDLRRTMATGLQRLGVRLEVTEAGLNHVAGSRAGIVGVYQRHDYAAERRTALAAWGEHLMALVENRDTKGNILRLPMRA